MSVNIEITQAFVLLSEMLSNQADLARQLDHLEKNSRCYLGQTRLVMSWIWFIAYVYIQANGAYLATAWFSGDRYLDTPYFLIKVPSRLQ